MACRVIVFPCNRFAANYLNQICGRGKTAYQHSKSHAWRGKNKAGTVRI